MRSLRTLLLASLLCAPACSFLGLDDIPVEGCTTDRDCDGLELIERPDDDCHTWQCNPATSRCEIDVLDADGDGAPAMLSPSMAMCASSGVDCDESDGARFPGNTETCSGTDSDCNGLIDDGAMDLVGDASCGETDTAITSFVAGFTEVAGFPVAETLELVVATGEPTRLVHSIVNTEGERTSRRTVMPVPAPTRLLSLVPVRANEWALLSTVGSCGPFVQRFQSGTAAISGAVPTDCEGRRLGDLANDPSQRDRGLMVSLGAGTSSRCNSGTPAPTALSASASVAAFPASGDYTTAAPIDLGETTSSSSPVVLAVGGGVYLVALPRADRSIEVLAITASGDTASSEVIYTETEIATDEHPDLVSLARGADGEYVLSWSFLCGAGNQARFLSWTGASSASQGELIESMSGAPLQTTAVFQPLLDEWLLISASGGALQGRRLQRDGMPIGEQFEIAGQFVGVRVLAQALETTHAYRLFAVRDPITTPPDPEIPDCAALIDVGCLAPE